MKKELLKLLKIAVCISLLVGLISACQVDQTTTSTTKTEPAQSTSGTTSETTQENKSLKDYDNVMKVSGLITAYMGGPANGTNTNFYKRMLEEYKIDLADVSWDVEEGSTKISLFAAGGDMPDFVVQGGISPRDRELAEQLYQSGQLLEIEEYIGNTVELKRYLSDEIINAHRNADGTLTRLPNFAINPELADELTAEVLTVMTVRKDLREKVGFIEFPKTPDEFYEMLTAFDELPQVDGKDFIPFCTLWNGDSFRSHIAAMFGVQNHRLETVENGNRMYSIFEGEDYLKYLKYAAKLYRDGLVYADCYTTGWEPLYFDFAPNGLVGSFCMWSPDIDGLTIGLQNIIPEGFYEVMPLPRDEGVTTTALGHNNTLGNTVTLINNRISDPERFWLLLDFLTTREGLNWVNYGPPSKDDGNWYIDENTGKFVQNKEIADAKTKENPTWSADVVGAWCYGLTGVLKFTPDLTYDENIVMNRGRSEAKERYFDELYLDTSYDLFRIAEAGDLSRAKQGDVDKIFSEGESKIITTAKSDAEVESMYQAMISDAKAAGWMEILAEDYTVKYLPIFK